MTEFTVRDLQQMCRERKIKGFSRKKKSELLSLLGLDPLQSTEDQPTLLIDKVVRDVYDILFPEDLNRFRKIETRFTTRLRVEIERLFEQHHLVVTQKQGIDFILLDKKVLSIRGSLQTDFISPNRIGKLSMNEFVKQFQIPDTDIKNWIIDHIHILLPQYLDQTFGDYLLWIDEKTKR